MQNAELKMEGRGLGYFHYVILPHTLNCTPNTPATGAAELGGDDIVVAMSNCGQDDLGAAGTIMHELGHNLSLLHGGVDPPGPGWDWNIDGDATDAGISVELTGDGVRGTLRDSDDWSTLFFGGVSDATRALFVTRAIIVCTVPAPTRAP